MRTGGRGLTAPGPVAGVPCGRPARRGPSYAIAVAQGCAGSAAAMKDRPVPNQPTDLRGSTAAVTKPSAPARPEHRRTIMNRTPGPHLALKPAPERALGERADCSAHHGA